MRTILIINSKGGAGKTTVSTNVASYYASQNSRTAIMDFDPQGSSMQWLRQRPGHVESIHGAHAPANGAAPLNSHKMWIPDNTETLVIDAPAGVKGLLLKDLVRRASFILIPVTPSPIDIHATADFVKDLFLVGGARNTKAKIGVVANRVRQTSPGYEPLERFLSALQLPFLSRISDSDNYIRAVEKGLGVFEMEEAATHAERQEFLPIFRWLEGDNSVSVSVSVPPKTEPEKPSKVVSIETGKFSSLRTSGRTIFSSLLNTSSKFQR
jgi:chromosome partitioning protein